MILNSKSPAMPTDNMRQSLWNGLTKREYFAAAALQGLLANSGFTGQYLKSGLQDDLEAITLDALTLADSLLFDIETIPNNEETSEVVNK